jgi:hypothetical protein
MVNMNQSEIIKYYSRSEIQKAMIEVARNREVVGSSREGTFLKRPDTLLYPKDIEERVKNGVVAFHCSVERWTQPMQLSTELNPKELNNMRTGFDFIIDIDAKVKLKHSASAAKGVCEFLKDMGVSPSVKFSGSRGFHIGISGNAFPEKIDFKETRLLYPEIPQAITEFIIEKTREHILEEMIAIEGGVAALVNTAPSVSELTTSPFIDIDDGTGTYIQTKKPVFVDTFAGLEKGWGNRHLFRMPYSLHPKFWLVSLPIRFEDLKNFNRLKAKPEKVKTDVKFLVNKDGEATELLLKSLEWKAKQPREKEVVREFKGKKKITIPVPEEYFPPCIKLILKGIPDGKKRSLFSLITFLKNMNWSAEDIEKRINEWNNENSKPLSKRFIKTQLKWHTRQSRDLMPANCKSAMFYTSIGVCQPDRYCRKNPVNYVFKKMKVKNSE